ncbi:MAG: PilZ domain-containing protein [Chloroflexi bacterium]|nr:PilZ domain-containing protein [Chloroflexota bacterium]
MAVDPIITDLQYVMETGQELDILNFHKSFPITSKARVERIEGDTVDLKVQPPGSIILEAQEQTIILSRGLPEAVRARIISFDLLSGLLRLSDFAYVGSNFGDRMIARVEPEDTIVIEIESEDHKEQGTLADVSLSGVGVYVTRTSLQRGQVVQLTLPLPEGKVTLPGKILNISQTPENQQRLSIGFTRNAQEIAVIMRYIKDRRTEILSEIERMYERSYRMKVAQAKE